MYTCTTFIFWSHSQTSSGSGNTDIKRPHISEDLLDMALSGLQNPGLVLALLADVRLCVCVCVCVCVLCVHARAHVCVCVCVCVH